MRKYLFNISIVFLLIILGCTDVPISNRTALPDVRLLGCWMESETSYYFISKSENGICQVTHYSPMPPSMAFKADEPKLLYFASISDAKGSVSFLSQGVEGSFLTMKYTFPDENRLIVNTINEKYLENFAKKTDNGDIQFGTSANFVSTIKSHLRQGDLFHKSMTFNRRAAVPKFAAKQNEQAANAYFSSPESSTHGSTTPLKRNGQFGIFKVSTTKYIRELQTWDEPSDYNSVDEETNSIKFFENGVMIQFNSNETSSELYGAGLHFVGVSGTEDNSSTRFYTYRGLAKQDGQTVGSFTLDIVDHTYSDMLAGLPDRCRLDVEINYSLANLQERGFWGILLDGTDQIKLQMLVHPK